jgi:hypothetical protein
MTPSGIEPATFRLYRSASTNCATATTDTEGYQGKILDISASLANLYYEGIIDRN